MYELSPVLSGSYLGFRRNTVPSLEPCLGICISSDLLHDSAVYINIMDKDLAVFMKLDASYCVDIPVQ